MHNLNELTGRLISSKVEFVLVGGFAAAAYGVTLLTRDVDICCRFSEENLMRILQAFADLHPVHRSRPDMALDLTAELCKSLRNLYLKTDLGIVDCLGEILGVGDFDEVLKNSIEIELSVGNCRIIAIDALIRAKQAMNRNHDRITVYQLKEIKKLRNQI